MTIIKTKKAKIGIYISGEKITSVTPGVFLISSIGSGLEKIIDSNIKVPGISDIIFSREIYIPLLAFFALILTTIILRKIFFKD